MGNSTAVGIGNMLSTEDCSIETTHEILQQKLWVIIGDLLSTEDSIGYIKFYYLKVEF